MSIFLKNSKKNTASIVLLILLNNSAKKGIIAPHRQKIENNTINNREIPFEYKTIS